MWAIYYSDDTVITSRTATPSSLTKRRGVQVIVQDTHPEIGWHTTSGDHHYVWDDRGNGPSWWGVDDFGLYDYLLQPGSRFVIFGESVDNTRFKAIFDRAREDMLQYKTGYLPGERQP